MEQQLQMINGDDVQAHITSKQLGILYHSLYLFTLFYLIYQFLSPVFYIHLMRTAKSVKRM